MQKQDIRILLIDDEISLSEPLARLLRKGHNYQVQIASTAEEARAYIQETQGNFDVALIDNQLLPDRNSRPKPLGITLMNEIKATYLYIECILFTGWEMDTGPDALRAGAYRYLKKPFDHDELVTIIQMAAEHAKIKRERDLLTATIKISQSINRHLEIDGILKEIVDSARALINVDICTVVLNNKPYKIRSSPPREEFDKRVFGNNFLRFKHER